MHDWHGEVRARLASLHLKPEREADIVDEIAQHLPDQRDMLADIIALVEFLALRIGIGRGHDDHRALLLSLRAKLLG